MKTKKILSISFVISLFILLFQNCSDVKFETIDDLTSKNGDPISTTIPGYEQTQPGTGDPVSPGGPLPPGDPISPGGPLSPGDPLSPVNPFTPGQPNTNILNTVGEWASIAFEDNIDLPNAGDKDFNDAVFNYKISEVYNSKNELSKIYVVVRVREKISGNNHRLYLYLNGDTGNQFSNIRHKSNPAFLGTSDILLDLPDGSQNVIENVNNLIVVDATAGSKGKEYKLEITLKNPELNPRDTSSNYIDFTKYRFILQNHNSNKGIDIVEINPQSEMISSESKYPLGFMIPTDWTPPAEGQLIDEAYPKFIKYREWILDPAKPAITDEIFYWFN